MHDRDARELRCPGGEHETDVRSTVVEPGRPWRDPVGPTVAPGQRWPDRSAVGCARRYRRRVLTAADALDPAPRRVLVAGTAGVGKTTTAGRIARGSASRTPRSRALPRSRLGAAAVLRRRCRRRSPAGRGGSSSGSTPRPGRCSPNARTPWCGSTCRSRRGSGGSHGGPSAADSPDRTLERQRRAAALDVLHRPRAHPAVGDPGATPDAGAGARPGVECAAPADRPAPVAARGRPLRAAPGADARVTSSRPPP